MSEYKMVRLGDVCSFHAGISIDKRWLSGDADKGVPIVLHDDIEEGKASTYYAGEYDKEQMVHSGEYLVSVVDSLSIEPWYGEDALFSHHFCRLAPQEDKLNPVYMAFALKYIFGRLDECEDCGEICLDGDISVEELAETVIPLPDIDCQLRIVDVLNSAESLMNLQLQMLEKIEDLLDAKFIELFGDIEENSFNWKVVPLEELAERVPSRSILEKDRKEGEYPYYESTGIVDYIDQYSFDEDLLLVAKVGSALVSDDMPIAKAVSGKIWASDLVHVLRMKPDAGILPEYLEIVVNNLDIKDSLRGGVMPKLSKAALYALPIPVPDLELQIEFKSFLGMLIEQRDKIMGRVEEIYNIFESLNQRYFEGAINCEE